MWATVSEMTIFALDSDRHAKSEHRQRRRLTSSRICRDTSKASSNLGDVTLVGAEAKMVSVSDGVSE